jgi:hypothetical protein
LYPFFDAVPLKLKYFEGKIGVPKPFPPNREVEYETLATVYSYFLLKDNIKREKGISNISGKKTFLITGNNNNNGKQEGGRKSDDGDILVSLGFFF